MVMDLEQIALLGFLGLLSLLGGFFGQILVGHLRMSSIEGKITALHNRLNNDSKIAQNMDKQQRLQMIGMEAKALLDKKQGKTIQDHLKDPEIHQFILNKTLENPDMAGDIIKFAKKAFKSMGASEEEVRGVMEGI